MLGEGEEFLLFPVEEEFESEEGDDEPADDDAGGGVVDEIEAPPAGDDAEDGGWGHGEDGFPTASFAVDEVAHQIGGDEEGEDEADGGFGAEDFGHEDHVECGGAGEAAFGEADADGSQGGEQDGRLIGRKQGVLGEPVEEGHGSEGSLRSVYGGSAGTSLCASTCRGGKGFFKPGAEVADGRVLCEDATVLGENVEGGEVAEVPFGGDGTGGAAIEPATPGDGGGSEDFFGGGGVVGVDAQDADGLVFELGSEFGEDGLEAVTAVAPVAPKDEENRAATGVGEFEGLVFVVFAGDFGGDGSDREVGDFEEESGGLVGEGEALDFDGGVVGDDLLKELGGAFAGGVAGGGVRGGFEGAEVMASESVESSGFFVGLGRGFEDGFEGGCGEGGFDVFEAFEGWSDAGEGGVFLGDESQCGGAFGEVDALGDEPVEAVGEVGGVGVGLDESEDLRGVGSGVRNGGAEAGAFFFGFGFDDAEGVGADRGLVGVDAGTKAGGFLRAGEGVSR